MCGREVGKKSKKREKERRRRRRKKKKRKSERTLVSLARVLATKSKEARFLTRFCCGS